MAGPMLLFRIPENLRLHGLLKIYDIYTGEITNKMQPSNRIYYSTVY
jgi:hypothetical protein